MPAILTYALLSIPLIGAYAIFALGISLIYRSSRVLNLAHGAMAMLPAYITASLVDAGVPILVSLVAGVLSGGLLGIVVERIFVRRLRAQGPTAQTVGTVAVTGLLIAIAAKVWGTTPKLAPDVFPEGVLELGRSGIRYGDIGLFGTAIVVSLALFTFFGRTQFGLAMRGAAQNRRAASLMGIDPDLAAMAAWALGGGLAALAGILLAAVTNLDPYTLSLQALPAFVAALIGGLENLRGALIGAAIAGLSFGLVPYFAGTPFIGNLVNLSGAPQLALTILALVVLAARGRRLTGVETSGGLTSTASRTEARSRARGRHYVGVGLALLVWPLVVSYSILGSSLLAVRNALVAVSLVVMTGWVGQISLAQASFVGISALSTGLLARGFDIGFPLSMLLAAAVAALSGTILGVVALRVRGLYLAVATLIFAWMTDAFLFKAPFMGASGGSSSIDGDVIGEPGGIPTIDLTSRRALFYVSALILALVVLGLSNLRDTKWGRAFFAVRGSETAAASLGIDVVRTKLVAFALSGAIAGIAGNLLMLDLRTVVPNQFVFTFSLQFLAIAVVGGLGSLGGALAAGCLFAALEEVFYQVEALAGWLEVVSALLLTIVLLVYPGGLAALAGPIRRALHVARRRARVSERLAVARPALERLGAGLRAAGGKLRGLSREVGRELRSRLPIPDRPPSGTREDLAPTDWFASLREATANGAADVDLQPGAAADSASPAVSQPDGRVAEPLLVRFGDERVSVDTDVDALQVEGVTVRFGGLTAVDNVSLVVKTGSVTGLIGPNGAGKTTCFNAILGLNDPSAGKIWIHGKEATGLPPHLRARLGLARTFQVLQLFDDLSVFDNLLVATHQHNDAGILSNIVASERTLVAERAARDRVQSILTLLGLEDVAERPARGLPFGTLRMVELGRALVTGARLIMLDEPASGLNEAETDRLSEVALGIRGLGVSVLLIEHDIRMVSGICDEVYVLDRGQLIGQGTPADIRDNERVVQAYLGAPAGAETAAAGASPC